jgi:hypothetical protein
MTRSMSGWAVTLNIWNPDATSLLCDIVNHSVAKRGEGIASSSALLSKIGPKITKRSTYLDSSAFVTPTFERTMIEHLVR